MFDRLIHPPMTPEQFQEPRWARFLFAGTTAAWLWLVVRLYMAYVYLPAGWGKITSGKWLFGDGSPIQGLVGGAISSEDTPAWYAWFLENIVKPNASLFATLVALGETAIGLGLLVGLLTGIAGFAAAFVNGNFVLAGVARIEPRPDHPGGAASRWPGGTPAGSVSIDGSSRGCTGRSMRRRRPPARRHGRQADRGARHGPSSAAGRSLLSSSDGRSARAAAR